MALTGESSAESATSSSVSSSLSIVDSAALVTNGSSFASGSSQAKSYVTSTTNTSGSSSRCDSSTAVASQAGTSGSSSSTNWDRVKTAKITLDVAKSKLKDSPVDYEGAIDLLDQVSVVLKEELGDLNVETCDALYYYGSALLESYQLGADLMGNKANTAIRQYPTDGTSTADSLESPLKETGSAAKQKPEKPTSVETAAVPEAAKSEEAEVDSGSENESDLESLPGGGPLDGADDPASDGGEDDEEMAEEESSNAVNSADDKTADDDSRRSLGSGKLKSSDEGDAIAELRYAWEIFEISRVGYEKRLREGASHAEKLRLSDIHYKLSLCAAENGEQNVAIVEAERSLKVCEDACGPADRDLAEAYFNLGSVYSMYSLLSEAADNMKQAVAILEARKVQANLELQTKTEDGISNSDQRKVLEKELSDLNELIPDLMRRIQDTYEDMRLGTDEAKHLLDNWLKGVSDKCHTDAGVPVEIPAPLNDISHLVRRVQPKRPLNSEEDESAKRMKGTNGSAAMEQSELTNGKDQPDLQHMETSKEAVSEPKI